MIIWYKCPLWYTEICPLHRTLQGKDPIFLFNNPKIRNFRATTSLWENQAKLISPCIGLYMVEKMKIFISLEKNFWPIFPHVKPDAKGSFLERDKKIALDLLPEVKFLKSQNRSKKASFFIGLSSEVEKSTYKNIDFPKEKFPGFFLYGGKSDEKGDPRKSWNQLFLI